MADMVAKQSLGVSESTLMSELGYDPEAEREKRQLNAQDAGAALLGAFDKGAGAPPVAGLLN